MLLFLIFLFRCDHNSDFSMNKHKEITITTNKPPIIYEIKTLSNTVEVNNNLILECIANDPDEDSLQYHWEIFKMGTNNDVILDQHVGKINVYQNRAEWSTSCLPGKYKVLCYVTDVTYEVSAEKIIYVIIKSSPEELFPEYDRNYVIKNEEVLLFKAFQEKSEDLLDIFLLSWQDEIKPITSTEFMALNEIQKTIYFLYNEFYKPENNIQINVTNSSYYLVQDNIVYSVLDSATYSKIQQFNDSGGYPQKIEKYFRPNPDVTKPLLILNKKYKEVMNFYFNESTGYQDEYDYDKFPLEYVLEKKYFLETRILISSNHWEPKFWYYTFPLIKKIDFNSNFSKAIIHYRSSNWTLGGDEYVFKNSKWQRNVNIYSSVE